jgi:hypothetical protein
MFFSSLPGTPPLRGIYSNGRIVSGTTISNANVSVIDRLGFLVFIPSYGH